MLATLANDAGASDSVGLHLDAARLLAARSGDALKIADVAHQIDEIRKAEGDKIRASDGFIGSLGQNLRLTEDRGEAAVTMYRLGCAHRSQRNYTKAVEWHRRAYEASIAASDYPLAASALICIAEIAIDNDTDDLADQPLAEALALVEHRPAWDVKASGLYLRGRLELRKGDHRVAQETFRSALALASMYHIEHLATEIQRCLDSIEDWLSFRKPTSVTFRALAEELDMFESWYPEEARGLRRLWWYWRAEDVMNNVRSNAGSKALIISDDATEATRLAMALAIMFDVAAFATDRPHPKLCEHTMEYVPIPVTMGFPYFNTLFVASPN